MQKTLDLSIKMKEKGTIGKGYCIKDKAQPYESYMDNEDWYSFEDDMKKNYSSAYEEYNDGSGGELKEKNSVPPKMASYGSSSRMIFNLSKELVKNGFKFEEKLSTTVGGIANMDGYFEKENEQIYVEAKCREPYGAKPHLIEEKYEELYRYIDNDKSCNLNISVSRDDAKEENKSKINVKFSVGEMEITNFDIKQMICHLLGIATKLLNCPTEKKISFVYLCYNPKLITIINEKKTRKIYDTYDKMCAQCKAIEFKELFSVILRFLKEEKKIGKAGSDDISSMLKGFSFTLCDQENYLKTVK